MGRRALFASAAFASCALAPLMAQAADYPAWGSDGWKALFAVDIADQQLDKMPVPEPVDATRYKVTYKGEIAGFDVGRIFVDVNASPNAYEVGYKMEQKGIARWFSDAEATTKARGTFQDGKIAAHYYLNHDYERDDDQQYVEIFRRANEARMHLWTKPQYKFYQPVSEAMAKGAVDPMAAFVALAFTPMPAGESPCTRTVKVFDGRRRFDLQMTDEGTEKIRKGGKGRFSGVAHKCRLEQAKVAGYREKDAGDIEGDLWVYLTPVPEEFRTEIMAYVPVMVVAKRGIFTARVEGKNPTLTAPDGRTINLGAKAKR